MENNVNTKTETDSDQNWYDNVENLSNAALHRIIVENKFQPPINEKDIFSYGVGDSDIHKIYKIYKIYLTTKNTKLIVFQFKINHNIIYTKDKLKKVNLISNDVCHLCEREKHTIKHMLLKCTYVTLVWNEFFCLVGANHQRKKFIYQIRSFYMDL